MLGAAVQEAGPAAVEDPVAESGEVGDELLHAGVPVVLDGVVGPSGQVLRDLGPPVPVDVVGEEQDPFLRTRPILLADAGVQVVEPTLAALLPLAALHLLGDEGPPVSPVLLHQPLQLPILQIAPLLLQLVVSPVVLHRLRLVVSVAPLVLRSTPSQIAVGWCSCYMLAHLKF